MTLDINYDYTIDIVNIILVLITQTVSAASTYYAFYLMHSLSAADFGKWITHKGYIQRLFQEL